MFHHVARSSHRRLLFSTWAEGLVLWRAIVQAAPQPAALCIMPNHIHLLYHRDVQQSLGALLSGYARRWNYNRGEHGPLFEPPPPPSPVQGQTKIRRVHRYVLLNPCRAGLVDHPLRWPLCTYLDDLGLALPPVRRAVPDALAHHAYLGQDERVAPGGLPTAGVGLVDPQRVLRAVSTASRTPMHELGQSRGPARQLGLRSLRVLSGLSAAAAGEWMGVSRATAARASAAAGTDTVARLAWDPRCDGVDDALLAAAIRRSPYARFRR